MWEERDDEISDFITSRNDRHTQNEDFLFSCSSSQRPVTGLSCLETHLISKLETWVKQTTFSFDLIHSLYACVCLCAHQLWWDAFSVQSSWRLKYSWKFNLLLHEYDWLKISSYRSKNWHGEELLLYYYITTEYTVRLDLYSSSNYDPIRDRDTLKWTVKYKFYGCLLSHLQCLFLLRARIIYCIITI